ncbi:MAG TPA: hypothetical protein VF273_10200 [Pelobium sp.]
MRKYISAILLIVLVNSAFAQKVDSLQLLQDVNGGAVAFTPIATNAATFGNGYGTSNMAFIAKLRAYTTSILPVTLSSFKSKREANTVNVIWSTVSEANSDYFEVLKSSDGKNFTAIGIVRAANNSNQKVNYNFKDVNPIKGANYYQLNMVDLDGSSKKSIIVSTQFDIERADFSVYTDANNGTLALNVYSDKAKSAVFSIYDLAGKKIISKNIKLQPGSNSFGFNLNSNAKMIIAELVADGDTQSKKLFY